MSKSKEIPNWKVGDRVVRTHPHSENELLLGHEYTIEEVVRTEHGEISSLTVNGVRNCGAWKFEMSKKAIIHQIISEI
jgi:hypothetical protein